MQAVHELVIDLLGVGIGAQLHECMDKACQVESIEPNNDVYTLNEVKEGLESEESSSCPKHAVSKQDVSNAQSYAHFSYQPPPASDIKLSGAVMETVVASGPTQALAVEPSEHPLRDAVPSGSGCETGVRMFQDAGSQKDASFCSDVGVGNDGGQVGTSPDGVSMAVESSPQKLTDIEDVQPKQLRVDTLQPKDQYDTGDSGNTKSHAAVDETEQVSGVKLVGNCGPGTALKAPVQVAQRQHHATWASIIAPQAWINLLAVASRRMCKLQGLVGLLLCLLLQQQHTQALCTSAPSGKACEKGSTEEGEQLFTCL